ncbi:MAG: ribulokinase [Verrucomicrobiales bacterium]
MNSKNRSSKHQLLAGIDFGTLSARGLLVNAANGEELAARVFPYPDKVIEESLPGQKKKLPHHTALQNPADYLAALDDLLPFLSRQAKKAGGDIAGMGVDFTSSTVLPVLEDGTPLCMLDKWKRDPHAWVKLWKHHTPQPQADRINEVGSKRRELFLQTYGGRYSSEWFFSKILETQTESPKVFQAARYFLECGDWIVWQLCGQQTRSISAAGFKAMRVHPDGSGGWTFPSSAFFKDLKPAVKNVVAEKIAGEFLPPGAKAGTLKPDLSKRWNLPANLPVAVGNIDAHAAVPACGVTTPGKLVMIMGTSTCHLLVGDKKEEVEGICGVVAHGIVANSWGYEAGQAGVGDAFAWFVEHGLPAGFANNTANPNQTAFGRLEERAAQLKPGECGLLALDWWNGNRSILMDADLTGVLVGLNLFTRPHHIYRALMEGTAFGTRKIIEAFEKKGIQIEELYACGGLAHKNALMMQIYSDVLGRTIKVAAAEHTCALGAAMFGGVAAELFGSIHEAATKMVQKPARIYKPRAKPKAIYDRLYAEYNELHDYFGRRPSGTLKKLKQIKMAAAQS